GDAPMRADRAPRPDRAGLGRRAVADGEDQVELGAIGKFAPALRAIAFCRITERPQRMDRPRVHRAGRIAPGAERLEPALAITVEDRLAEDRAGGIARAQE